MRCELCHQPARALTILRVYSRGGLLVCESCYQAIDRGRRKPYSKVMDRFALAEVGYHANRKGARFGIK